MKTKSFNYFRNAFALIGFFIIACSVATTDEPTEPPVLSNIGKYQTTHINNNNNTHYITALNTETGVLKLYQFNNSVGWQEVKNSSLSSTITFTH